MTAMYLLAVLGVLFVFESAWWVHVNTRDAQRDIEFIEERFWWHAFKATA